LSGWLTCGVVDVGIKLDDGSFVEVDVGGVGFEVRADVLCLELMLELVFVGGIEIGSGWCRGRSWCWCAPMPTSRPTHRQQRQHNTAEQQRHLICLDKVVVGGLLLLPFGRFVVVKW